MNIETLKATIRPGLAIWSTVMLTLAFVLQRPMIAATQWVCLGIILEWAGERGVKRAKELFGG